jgi:hypothetical protein
MKVAPVRGAPREACLRFARTAMLRQVLQRPLIPERTCVGSEHLLYGTTSNSDTVVPHITYLVKDPLEGFTFAATGY